MEAIRSRAASIAIQLFSEGTLLFALLACGEQSPTGTTRLRVAFNFAERGTRAGESLSLRIWYRRRDSTAVTLADTTIIPDDSAPHVIPLILDITNCVGDDARVPRGVGCPLRVELILRSAQGAVLDSVTVGPFDAAAGAIVNVPPVSLRRITSLDLAPLRDTLSVGDTTTVVVTVRDGSGNTFAGKQVSWRIAPATVATISAVGMVTAVAPGTALISATAIDDTTKAGQASVVVRGIISVHVAQDSLLLPQRTTATLIAIVTVIGTPNGVRWLSRSPAIASIDAITGLLTAVAPGRAIVTVRALADSAKTDSVAVIVVGVRVTIAADTMAVELGAAAVVPLTVLTGGGVSRAVTWGSSNAAVATVSSSGRVSGVSVGSAVVTATAVADQNERDSITVVVRRYCVGPGTNRSGTISSSETWSVAGRPYYVSGLFEVTGAAVLTIEPGVDVCMGAFAVIAFIRGGRLSARGSFAAPVVITAADTTKRWDILFFEDQTADSSYLTNAIVEYGSGGNPWAIWMHDNKHALVIDSSVIRRHRFGALLIQGTTMATHRVSRTLFEDNSTDPNRQIPTGTIGAGGNVRLSNVVIRQTIRGPGLTTFSTITLDSVTVTDNQEDGIVVLNTGVVLTRVNLLQNGGVGLRNVIPANLPAQNLWWGDPSGPSGVNGDGVAGNVTFSPVATAPFGLATPFAAASFAGTRAILPGSTALHEKTLRKGQSKVCPPQWLQSMTALWPRPQLLTDGHRQLHRVAVPPRLDVTGLQKLVGCT